MTFERLRHVADPDHLPALKLEDVHQRPALGLGALDPRPRVLLLYGSLRERSYSRLVVEESARLLQFFGCETRIFDPSDLPLPDQVKVDVRLFRWQIALGIAIADAGWRIMGGLCNYRFGSAPIGIFSHARTFVVAIVNGCSGSVADTANHKLRATTDTVMHPNVSYLEPIVTQQSIFAIVALPAVDGLYPRYSH